MFLQNSHLTILILLHLGVSIKYIISIKVFPQNGETIYLGLLIYLSVISLILIENPEVSQQNVK